LQESMVIVPAFDQQKYRPIARALARRLRLRDRFREDCPRVGPRIEPTIYGKFDRGKNI
jgi:hypothetical protein